MTPQKILEERIKGAEIQIADSDEKIQELETYRMKWQVRLTAFEEVLEEISTPEQIETDYRVVDYTTRYPEGPGGMEKLACPDALKGLAEQAMNEHTHIHTEEPPHDAALKNMIEKYELPKKITKDTLCIEPFEFPRDDVITFKRLVFYEVPGSYSAALRYINGTVYVDRRLIMGLPYPMPPGLLKNSGIASNGCTAIRLYREYLFREATTAVSKSTNDPSGNGVQDPDEWMYHKILNTDTSTKNYDGNKIEGDLE